jgi:hypothetical protein
MWPRPRPSFTTILAGFISILLSLAWMAIGLAFIAFAVIGGAQQEIRRSFGELVEVLDVFRVFFSAIGAGIFFVALLTFIFGWKIFRRRGWARIMQIVFFVMFLILTLGVLFVTFSGAYSNASDVNVEELAGGGIILGAYAGALFFVVLLLVLPPTSRDFRRVREWEAPAPQLQVQPVASQPPPPPPPPATTP